MNPSLTSQMFLRLNFLIALAATLGSLYFSEVVKFPPCTLCWYQRISIYPLVVIFGVAIWTNDRSYRKYATPLLLIGLILAIYHNLLYFGLIPQPIVPCTGEVSCSAKQLELFAFITIPLMSLFSFIGMLVLLIVDNYLIHKEGSTNE